MGMVLYTTPFSCLCSLTVFLGYDVLNSGRGCCLMRLVENLGVETLNVVAIIVVAHGFL